MTDFRYFLRNTLKCPIFSDFLAKMAKSGLESAANPMEMAKNTFCISSFLHPCISTRSLVSEIALQKVPQSIFPVFVILSKTLVIPGCYLRSRA